MAREITIKVTPFMIALKFIGIGLTALVGLPALYKFLKERGLTYGY